MRLTVLPLLLLSAVTVAAQQSSTQVDEALARPILAADQTRIDTQVWLASQVPVLQVPATRAAWDAKARELRQRVLDEVVYRGQAKAWRTQKAKVEEFGVIEADGYRVRKIRFEAVPGLHVPALIYEPARALDQKIPLVLNFNGHEGTGMANSYHQARCINLAKKGLYAINVEWIGQTQLAVPGLQHYRMNQLDLVGTPGLAVFYESLRRTLDIGLALPRVDATKVAVTGLSGGGWQTIMLSALDTRVTLANPVAGFSSYVTRTQWPDKDLGDSEQTPSDLASVADYTHLAALVAPRPLQLTHNALDSCCYRADYAVGPLLQQAGQVFSLLGVRDRLAFHVNYDKGHNYEQDNREAFYRFLHKNLLGNRADFDPREVDVTKDLRDVEGLRVPVPADNATFTSLARGILASLPAPTAPTRARLQQLVKAPTLTARAQSIGKADGAEFWQLHLDNWTVPVTELSPASVNGRPGEPSPSTTILLSDGGRAKAAGDAKRLLGEGTRVAAMDPWYFGESSLGRIDFLYGLLMAGVGERPLGLETGQVIATAKWLKARDGRPVTITARGPRTSLIALVAAALEPEAIAGVQLHESWSTLREVLDRDITAKDMPEMFAFGLLAEFDVAQIKALVAPRKVEGR
ncbi:xylan esterase [Luteitalea sp. TBR-22]|uniref:alpha/beta hydrolase family protein n=1 Tax=Luteitalea sp. TBR-22 TaxID=2802971 RepID=UPI001AF3C831|nr:acetylxylan esterase [Luteitalea sp. TBR-22]BCS34995.1 xylan esterase [Luteitalea sp. TBR-22]